MLVCLYDEKKEAFTCACKVVDFHCAVDMVAASIKEWTNEPFRWLHEAWRTLTTITRDYLLFYTEKFTAFSLNVKKNPYLISESYTSAALCVCIHRHFSNHFLSLLSLASRLHFHNMTQNEIATRAIHIFNFANRRIFAENSMSICVSRFVISFRMFALIIYQTVEVLKSYKLVICSYRDWCYI